MGPSTRPNAQTRSRNTLIPWLIMALAAVLALFGGDARLDVPSVRAAGGDCRETHTVAPGATCDAVFRGETIATISVDNAYPSPGETVRVTINILGPELGWVKYNPDPGDLSNPGRLIASRAGTVAVHLIFPGGLLIGAGGTGGRWVGMNPGELTSYAGWTWDDQECIPEDLWGNGDLHFACGLHPGTSLWADFVVQPRSFSALIQPPFTGRRIATAWFDGASTEVGPAAETWPAVADVCPTCQSLYTFSPIRRLSPNIPAEFFPLSSDPRASVYLNDPEILGRITDLSGRPVSAREVDAFLKSAPTDSPCDASPRPFPNHSTMTEVDGSYRIPVDHSAEYQVCPREPYAMAPPFRDVSLEFVEKAYADFTLEAYRLSGRVTGPGGWGVSAEIVIQSLPPGPDQTEVHLPTDGDGSYEIWLAPGTYEVHALVSVEVCSADDECSWVERRARPETVIAVLWAADAEADFEVWPDLHIRVNGPQHLPIDEFADFEVLVTYDPMDPHEGGLLVTSFLGPTHSGSGFLWLELADDSPLPEVLTPGETFLVRYRGVALDHGQQTVRWTSEGVTERGTHLMSQAMHMVRLGDPPLNVVVTPKPPEFTLGDRPANRFQVDVTLANISGQPLENVNIIGGASPFLMGTLLEEPGVALELLGPLPDPIIGTLEPGQSVTRTYEFQALDVAHARLQVIAAYGAANEPTRTSVGVGTVKVNSDVFIEVSLKQTRTPNIAGQAMIISGTVKNITEDKTVGVVAFPTVDQNAANGILRKVVPNPPPGLPTGVQGWVLGPGESLEVTATVATTFAIAASDAIVSYFFMAWVHNENDEKTQLRTTQIKIDREDGASDSFAARLAPADPPYDNPYAYCGFSLWYCGLVVGVENFANSTLDLFKMAGAAWMAGSNYGWRMTLWAGEMLALSAHAVLGDPVAQEALRQEIAMDLQALIDAGALTLTQGQELAPLVAQALGEMVGEIIEVQRTGDEFAVGKFIGENPDMLIEGPLAIAKSLATRKLLKGAVTHGSSVVGAMNKLDDARKAQVDEILARAGKTDDDLMKLLKAGDELNTDAIRKMWGVSEDDIRILQEIADKENVTIAFRSRNPRSAQLIENALAYEKPELLKIKTVSDVDMDWLGYPKSTDGLVVFMEPHPALKQLSIDDYVRAANNPGSEEALRVRQAVDQAFEALDPKPTDPATIQKVKDRMLQRAEEFAVFEPKLNHWQQKGIDVGYKPGSNAGENTMAAITDVRQLQKQSLAGTPQPAWTIEISGRNNGPFKPVTGDIDITAIFGRDGKPITDPEQRARIIGKLREAIGMKHGESFTFRGPGREGYLEGAGKQVVIQKNQPPRVGEFVKRSSITESTPHSNKMKLNEADDFIMLAGIAYEGRAANFWESMVLSPHINVLTTFFDVRRAYFYGRQVWDKVVDGLESGALEGSLNRSGSVAQPDGLGGVKEWVPATNNTQPLIQGLLSDTGVRIEQQVSGGEWRPVSLGALLARGGGKVVLAPQTTLFSPAPSGSTVLDVTSFLQLDFEADSEWFEPGDQVVIDPRGPNEEFATVLALGSLVLSGPLQKDHMAGELVLLVKSPPAASNSAPACDDVSSNVLAGAQLSLVPACTDPDGDSLTYSITMQPAHGTASVVSGQLVFVAGSSTGPVTFEYQASDGIATSEPATAHVFVGTAPTIAGTPLTKVTAGDPVQFSFTVTGDPVPVVALHSGQLPPGLLLSPTGELSGTASQAGLWSFSVTASNGFGADPIVGPFSIEVSPPGPPPPSGATLALTYGLVTPAKNQGPSALLLAGTFRLPQGKQLACGQDVTISVAGYSETIPGSKFRRILHLCVYLGLPTASNYFVEFAYTLNHGTWSAAGVGRQVTFANFNGTLPLTITIGPNAGSVTGQFVDRKGAWNLR